MSRHFGRMSLRLIGDTSLILGSEVAIADLGQAKYLTQRHVCDNVEADEAEGDRQRAERAQLAIAIRPAVYNAECHGISLTLRIRTRIHRISRFALSGERSSPHFYLIARARGRRRSFGHSRHETLNT